MSGLDALRKIFAGEPTPLLLQDSRLWGMGGETYGRLAIGELMRAYRDLLPGEGARVIEAPGGVALFGPGAMVWADLYDGHVHRLWRLGALEAVAPAQGVSVPTDPDRSQIAGALGFRAEDHPDLAHRHAALVPMLEAALLEGVPAHHRARALIVRAHSQGEQLAVLARVSVASAGARRVPLDHFAAVAARVEDGRVVDVVRVADTAGIESARPAEWRPRI